MSKTIVVSQNVYFSKKKKKKKTKMKAKIMNFFFSLTRILTLLLRISIHDKKKIRVHVVLDKKKSVCWGVDIFQFLNFNIFRIL